MNTLTQIRSLLLIVARWLTLATGYFLLAASLIVCLDILLRRLANISLTGADEISGYALAAASSGALAYTLFLQGHIRIDAVYRLLPLRGKAVMDIIAALAFVLIAVLVTYASTLEFLESATYHAVANTPWRTPLWIPQLLWLGGLYLFVAAAVVNTLEATARVILGDFAGAHAMAGLVEGV